MAEESDDLLIQRTLHGDVDAFGVIVERYRSRVFNLAYRMLGDRDRADEAAQEVFVRAYTGLGSYRPSGSFSSWLLSIAANLCIDLLRQEPFAAVPIDNPEAVAKAVAGAASDPHAAYGRTETQQLTHNALGRLPDMQRLVIVLVHIHGMSYQQAAEVLGQPVGTVKSHAHRGRARLKRLLAPHMEENGL